jgi:uncharacterized membrane protein YdbT with pleckstrin-like domain
MSYITSALIPGERLIYQTRLHWVVMLGQLVLGILLLLGCAALGYFCWLNRLTYGVNTLRVMEGGAAALFLVAFVTLLMGAVRRNATELAVTNRRVVIKQGLTSRRTIEMLLSKIETIEVNESTAGRIFGFGTIVLIGTGGTSEPFRQIRQPLEFRSQVLQQLEKLPAAGTLSTEAVAVATPPALTAQEARSRSI